MYGNNPVRKQVIDKGYQLWVQQVFATVQGEGPASGTPAIFIRLAGCNLKCWFCDTDFESSEWHPTLPEIVEKVRKVNTPPRISLVVITGGEPLRQSIVPLIDMLNSDGLYVQVETAGTLWLPMVDSRFRPSPYKAVSNEIICSPKTPKLNDQIVPYISAFKYILKAGQIDEGDGLPLVNTQVKDGPSLRVARPWDYDSSQPSAPIFVQPCDEGEPAVNRANEVAAVKSALQFGYRLSLQVHKLVGLP